MKVVKINLQAKAKHFKFNFKAIKNFPTDFHFSFFLKISNLLLLIRVSSDSSNNNNNFNQPTRIKSIKARVVRFIDKFRYRPTKRNGVANRKCSRFKRLKPVSHKESICDRSVVIENLALLIQSVFEKDVKGTIIHFLSIFLYILGQLKIFLRKKKVYVTDNFSSSNGGISSLVANGESFDSWKKKGFLEIHLEASELGFL